MARFLLRRVLFMLLTTLTASILVFVAAEVAPGNVARKVLGNFATPEQEESFRDQLGLNQPLHIRYVTWLIGSDWRASKLVGMPLQRIRLPDTVYWEWWAIDEDGTPIRWRFDEGDLIVVRRAADGSTTESLDNERWQTGEEGVKYFWGVSTEDQAVKWATGGDSSYWIRAKGAGWWIEKKGGGVEYIPLQKGLLRGDLGKSIKTGRSVTLLLMRRLKNSVILAAAAFIIVMPLALIFGLIAGLNEGKLIDRVLSIGGLATTATPEFAAGIFLILIFSTWLGILPGVTVFTDENAILNNPLMLVLPVLTLTLIELGYVLRITRASMVDVMKSAYVRTAVLKGLPRRTIVFKHAMRNALIAPVTVIILHINWLLGGIVVVEAVFGYPGLGRFLYDSALYKDYFALEAGVILMVLLAVGTQLLGDFIYTLLNPRIRYS